MPTFVQTPVIERTDGQDFCMAIMEHKTPAL